MKQVPQHILDQALGQASNCGSRYAEKLNEVRNTPVSNQVSCRINPVAIEPIAKTQPLPEPTTPLEIERSKLEQDVFIIESSCRSGHRNPRLIPLKKKIREINAQIRADASPFGGFINAYAEANGVAQMKVKLIGSTSHPIGYTNGDIIPFEDDGDGDGHGYIPAKDGGADWFIKLGEGCGSLARGGEWELVE